MALIRSRWLLWRLPALVASAAGVVFAAGFWLALRGTLGDPIGEAPPTPAPPAPISRKAGERLLLVLGDSLARGTGDETGRGFAVDTLEAWKKHGPAQIVNLGVNGAESSDVRTSVESASFRGIAATADWILLSAGGNDLSHAVPVAASAPVEAVEQVGQARRRYLDNLRAILSQLRQANSSAPICLVGLYNPFGEDSSTSRLSASVILSWNAAAQETALAFPGVSVVPTFDIFFRRPERLAGDRFHPNRKGYELIAQRIFQDLPVEGSAVVGSR